jgi:hypothetical protein
MLIAYLDILGFSRLIKQDMAKVNDVLCIVQDRMKTAFMDDKLHPQEEFEKHNPKESWALSERSRFSTFDYFISASDSIVIISKNDTPLFMRNLSYFMATVFMLSAKSFQKNFLDMECVDSERFIDYDGIDFHPHKAEPILFRGGIAQGERENICISEIRNIIDKKLERAWNISGETFLKAVKAESRGKGPRLFCDKSITEWVNKLPTHETEDLRKILRRVGEGDEESCELVWTIDACESNFGSTRGTSISNLEDNATRAIRDNLFPPAKNLCEAARKLYDEEVFIHYKEFMYLTVNGILQYSKKNNLTNIKEVEKNLLKEMENIGLKLEKYIFMSE